MKKFTTFGEHLRTLREINGLTLREVATSLSLDTSLLAKIERNERQPTRQLIKQLADFFKVDEKELVDEFLSDQIVYKILNEETDLNILKVAESKIKYLKTHNA
ncbi:helix-turn-helix domain-containing protein [Flavobacterium filum]|uniref:helix-turn-helix domain-containing protein n=1 Tax=Flavobacterium filum TaxID=370974 RepID=UPI000A04ACBC|nr:helix-turn-helix transcriptional regulator [Flavobacterium filum]